MKEETCRPSSAPTRPLGKSCWLGLARCPPTAPRGSPRVASAVSLIIAIFLSNTGVQRVSWGWGTEAPNGSKKCGPNRMGSPPGAWYALQGLSGAFLHYTFSFLYCEWGRPYSRPFWTTLATKSFLWIFLPHSCPCPHAILGLVPSVFYFDWIFFSVIEWSLLGRRESTEARLRKLGLSRGRLGRAFSE